MLSWVSQRLFRVQLARRRVGFPTPSLMRFPRTPPEGEARAALQGIPERPSPPGPKTWPTLLRFATGTCPRVLPTTAMSRSDCSDQEPMRSLRDPTSRGRSFEHVPGDGLEGRHSSGGRNPLQRPGANPRQASLFTTLSKRTFSGQAFRCQFRVSLPRPGARSSSETGAPLQGIEK
jgi:hypothetical protein